MYLCVVGHVFVCCWSCICVLRVSILSVSTILILDSVIVLTVWYFCISCYLDKMLIVYRSIGKMLTPTPPPGRENKGPLELIKSLYNKVLFQIQLLLHSWSSETILRPFS